MLQQAALLEEETGDTKYEQGETVTRERMNHVIAFSLLVAGLVAGGVCWVLDGTTFWVVSGLAMALVVAGVFFAGRASPRQQEDGTKTR